MRTVATLLGLDMLAVQCSVEGLVGTGRRGNESLTLVTEIGTPRVNTARLRALDVLGQETGPWTAQELAARVEAIEALPHGYSVVQTAVAVGAACGAFAVLNGGIGLEVLAATVGGGAGQGLRSLLLRRRVNQYAATAVCALAASGVYCLLAVGLSQIGMGVPRHTIGFMSSVLFLVPGFPLIAALLDLMQYEMTAAVTRLAYVAMLLLAAGVGLAAVIAVAGLTVERPESEAWHLGLFVLRLVASFVAGAGLRCCSTVRNGRCCTWGCSRSWAIRCGWGCGTPGWGCRWRRLPGPLRSVWQLRWAGRGLADRGSR